MANTAWGVISWVSVEMDVAEWKGLLRNFRHSVTSVLGEPDEYGCHYGYTLWKANHSDRPDTIGLAWDWREVQPGVVGQDDPMSILTNVRLTRHGQLLGAAEKILELNDTVYQIGWQRVARRQLHLRANELPRRPQPAFQAQAPMANPLADLPSRLLAGTALVPRHPAPMAVV
jgi:hypothetical protein